MTIIKSNVAGPERCGDCPIFDKEGNFCSSDLVPRTPNCDKTVKKAEEEEKRLKVINIRKALNALK